MELESIYKGKKVLITGHTGFKGTWLVHLMNYWGADVYGYSLVPEAHQLLFTQSQADQLCKESVFADINDFPSINNFITKIQPDFVFHLAAQSLVIPSFERPLHTIMTNVMGTAHVLEALKSIQKKCIALMITTDKVYQNNEDGRLYAEDDKLGGKDPYSASKACDEIIISSYKHSFYNPNASHPHIIVSSVRAGNVIGGGDFAENRIIPDLVRAIDLNIPAQIRQPKSIRPWQHVLEPLFAYSLLAAKMTQDESIASAYNIGPYEEDMLTVEEIIQIFHETYGKGEYTIVPQNKNHIEAKTLKLDNSKIANTIGFTPKLNAKVAIQWTADWYKNSEKNFADKCLQDIQNYLAL